MPDKTQPRGKWRAKLEKDQEPKVVEVPAKWVARFGEGKMLVATPLLVDALVRTVPEGLLVTIDQIRERLARDFCADSTCPLTTGIFLRITAEAAVEDLDSGREQVTPYWRVIRSNGSLVDKFPGGVQAQAERLRAEGHAIDPGMGKKAPRVREFEKVLAKL